MNAKSCFTLPLYLFQCLANTKTWHTSGRVYVRGNLRYLIASGSFSNGTKHFVAQPRPLYPLNPHTNSLNSRCDYDSINPSPYPAEFKEIVFPLSPFFLSSFAQHPLSFRPHVFVYCNDFFPLDASFSAFSSSWVARETMAMGPGRFRCTHVGESFVYGIVEEIVWAEALRD